MISRGRLQTELARVGANREVGRQVLESGFPCELLPSRPAI